MILINDNPFDTVRAHGIDSRGRYVEVLDVIERGTRHYLLTVDGERVASGNNVRDLLTLV